MRSPIVVCMQVYSKVVIEAIDDVSEHHATTQSNTPNNPHCAAKEIKLHSSPTNNLQASNFKTYTGSIRVGFRTLKKQFIIKFETSCKILFLLCPLLYKGFNPNNIDQLNLTASGAYVFRSNNTICGVVNLHAQL